MALSHTGGTPGGTAYWTSTDGRSWMLSSADPLGIVPEEMADGGANGDFVGDGTRLLGWGTRRYDLPFEYWVSLDGVHWTKLAIHGDIALATGGHVGPGGQVLPFLLRDGVLSSGDQRTWFGAATE